MADEIIPKLSGIDEYGRIPDPDDPDNQWRGSFVLKDMDEFYNTIDKSNMSSISHEVEFFVSKYQESNKGCGCGKRKRVRMAVEAYRLVAGITNGEVHQSFQLHYLASSVIFKQDGQYFGTLGVPSDEFDEPVF